tara:strand:+ start:54 stop:281 length:228 start_codon:yes stop_codon:yes gene_type:complete
MTETNKKNEFDLTKFFVGVALLLCSVCLALIVISLRPVAKWANYQSICVEQESVKAPISWAVRKCNGRSKVYQVK